jgi:exonuclease SbcC
MRPIRLELKGFTSFRDRAELDFSQLDVFAISGATGSGKSSLLDAMTYALYGRVERVDNQVRQLISQGQPRMAVTLEYEVGPDRYRVTRSTPARGNTRIMLERRGADGEWAQAGEGSDRVRDAERMIARTIGMSYDGFTRSVLLPQGKFQEFLVGDATKRREILTELLGLSLFRRMAELAGAIARKAGDRAGWTTELLEREFSDATPEGLKLARAAAREAERREKALAEAAKQVIEILARWQAMMHSIEELRACAREAARVADGSRAGADELATLIGPLEAALEATKNCASASKTAEEAQGRAQAALLEAEATTGSLQELTDGRLKAHTLAELVRDRQAKQARRDAAHTARTGLAEALAEAETALVSMSAVLVEREADVHAADVALEDARHADLVAAVSAGVRAGDPCPVCGLPLERAPRKSAAGGLGKATKSLAAARKAQELARKEAAQAERSVDSARLELEASSTEDERLAAGLAEVASRIAEEDGRLRTLLGDTLPEDPAAAVDERIAHLQQLDRAERDAARAAADATQSLLKAEQDRHRIAGLMDRHRDRLNLDHQPLFDRAARAIGKTAAPIKLPPPPEASDPSALQRYADKLAGALEAFALRLGAEVEARSEVEGDLLQEAADRVGDLAGPAPTLEALALAVDASCRTATVDVATTAQRAADLEDRLERKKQLGDEAEQLDGRARLFRALAQELRADKLIAFLQAEALQVLAAAGSERLASLSDGRYRLLCREDEFLVVDTWNGDEERSVRTLSGGETFLASLSLALALADQVRSLSTTDRARLDSLFLDEGFGTLDQESLGIVVEAIEQLAGDGRLVGVITHVADLAEQFPRIEVEKSRRGSTLKLVAT